MTLNLRDYTDTFIRSSSPGGKSRQYHAPADREEPVPLCCASDHSSNSVQKTEYHRKNSTVFPPSFVEDAGRECDECMRLLQLSEVEL